MGPWGAMSHSGVGGAGGKGGKESTGVQLIEERRGARGMEAWGAMSHGARALYKVSTKPAHRRQGHGVRG